jgi:hypothetical protein
MLEKNDLALQEKDFKTMGNLNSSTGNNSSSVQSGNNEIKSVNQRTKKLKNIPAGL